MSEINYKDLLLTFIASLTLSDHMGDVADDVDYVLKQLGLEMEWDGLDELGTKLGEMGITTLYGTSLTCDDDDEDEE